MIRIIILFIGLLIPINSFSGISIDGVALSGISTSNSDVGSSNAITITTPTQYRTFQRSGSTGTITITGTYTGSPTAIEASFNGGAYSTISASPSGGSYSGSLTSQSQGQGTLTVRFVNDTAISATKTYIGIGDIYLIAGQSNASGRGTNNQSYSSTDGFKATLYGNDYNWKELTDPYDSASGQVDSVSDDTGLASGSWVVLLATQLMNNQHVPVAIIPSAKGGSSLTQWQPGSNHQDRTTLYGSAVYRSLQAGGIKAILWWQGESDTGQTEATSTTRLNTIVNAFDSDLGVGLMPCKLQDLTGVDETNINNAIAAVWTNPNALTGPDLHDLTPTDTGEDGTHLKTNAHLQTVADRFFTSLQTAFGW